MARWSRDRGTLVGDACQAVSLLGLNRYAAAALAGKSTAIVKQLDATRRELGRTTMP